jgi:hypothetical protein
MFGQAYAYTVSGRLVSGKVNSMQVCAQEYLYAHYQ